MDRIIQSSIHDNGLCSCFLFHGTDLAVWELSSEKRLELKNSCWKIIEYCRPGIEKQMDAMKAELADECRRNAFDGRIRQRLGSDYDKYFIFFNKVVLTAKKDDDYQHDGFYVTNMFNRAKNYAYEAVHFGEIGYLAFYSRVSAEKLGLELSPITDEVMAAIEATMWFERLEHKPVVYCLEGVEIAKLKKENGDSIRDEDEVNEMLGSFRLSNFDLANPGKVKVSRREV